MTSTAMSIDRFVARHGGPLKLHRSGCFGEVSNGPFVCEVIDFPRSRRTPVDPAITYIDSGGPPLLAPKRNRRGGARNKACRESNGLSAAQVANLRAAVAHADAIGLPLNRMITTHWEAAGVPLEGMARATGRFIDLMSKTLARHGSRTAWLWVHENGDGKGGHCHLLAHVPPGHVSRLTGLQRGWLCRITGKPYRRRVIRSVPIGGRLGLEAGNRDLHARNLEVAVAYVLKGTNEPGGRIVGKRCGTSQNIASKARKAREQTDG